MPAEETPALGQSFVSGYDGKNKAFPIVSVAYNPYEGGYAAPGAFTAHPNTAKYPTHKFVSSTPTASDQRVLWNYMILPGPVMHAPLFYDDERGAVRTTEQIVASVTSVASATVTAGGSGGTNGASQTVTGTTGTGTKFTALVTVAGNAITAVNSISGVGSYTVPPTLTSAEPVTGVGLVGATLNLVMQAMEVGSFALTGGIPALIRYEPTENVYLLKKVTETWAANGPITGPKETVEDDSGTVVLEYRQLMPASFSAGVVITAGVLDKTEKLPSRYGSLLAYRVQTRIPVDTAHDEASAFIEYEKDLSFLMPGVIDTSPPVGSYQPERTRDTPHRMKVWYVNSDTEPAFPAVDEFITKAIIVSGTNYGNVLIDAYPGIGITATTPDATTYLASWKDHYKIIRSGTEQVKSGRWRCFKLEAIFL